MKEIIKPEYPSRIKTLMGFALPEKVLESLRKESDAALSLIFPIKYPVTLEKINTSSKMHLLEMGHVVTHLELADWCDWHGYQLFTLDGNPELALPGERTKLS